MQHQTAIRCLKLFPVFLHQCLVFQSKMFEVQPVSANCKGARIFRVVAPSSLSSFRTVQSFEWHNSNPTPFFEPQIEGLCITIRDGWMGPSLLSRLSVPTGLPGKDTAMDQHVHTLVHPHQLLPNWSMDYLGRAFKTNAILLARE